MKKSLLILSFLSGASLPLSAQYCTPATTSGGVFISTVNFTDASITGGSSYTTGSTGFSVTLGSAGTMQRNCEVSIPVTLTNPTGIDRDVSLRLFIDYNGDNDFEDNSELAVSYSNSITGSGSLVANLNFKVLASSTTSLRARFALRQGATPATACDAYLGEVEDYTLSVPVNAAPVLNTAANPFINALLVSQTDNEGISIGDFINSSTTASLMTDAGSCIAKGIAIVGITGTHGDWEYLLPSGTWTAMGSVSNSNALLLAQDDNGAGTRIRFNPTSTGTATIEIRAWDQSEGISGAYIDASTTGGSSAFSVASKTVSHVTYSTASATGNVSVFMPVSSSYTSNFNLRRALMSRITAIAKQADELTFDNINGGGNDIAVDFINNKVVWIGGAAGNELMRSNTDGTLVESINNSSFGSPSGVAVGGGKVFVADNGNALYSCNPDGSSLTAITGGAGQATNIANTGDIEFASGKIYYINQPVSPGDYYIVQANPDGTGTVDLYSTPNIIYGLAIAGANMYWTEWDDVNTSEVLSRGIAGGTVNTLITQNGRQYRDLVADADNNRIYFVSLDAATLNFTNILSIPLSGGTPTSRLTLSDIVYSMAISTDLSVLPVRYLNVEASKHNQQVLLQWKVGNEIDVLRYAIQRSADGQQFASIGEVVATSSSQYTFTDVQPLKGNAYYRIVNIDKDGRLQYSNVVLLSGTLAAAVQWYPTLIQHNTVTLRTSNMTAGKYSYSLLNMNGQVLMQHSLQLSSNAVQQIQLPASLPAGTYQMVLQNATERWAQTVVKQ